MKKILYLLALPLCLFACSPENEEVKDEYVDVAPQADALDSIANVPKDNVKTDENTTTPTLPLPQPVMEQLTEKYPGWEKPEIAADASAKVSDETAAIARGDFDGDTRQDVALQFALGKELVIVAALQKEDGEFVLEELSRDILFNERGTLKSLYYLYTAEEGEDLYNYDTNQELELSNDAVSVGIDNSVMTYVYQNGSFEKVATTE
ncbi:hypothetical protein [Pontibacter akesuensis]|uniref:Lipoprotein n=1 Tax=Pontibacter akesuensis TaxID=388950 RepID=A0A1I7KVT0_9BACT|nr:hypothetical protein [Pontibacter akesuensis]GHA78198.1 hypothetical protein GCM10007389_35210 [Pontibacter akesuensis]SFV01404.1 hypothetical protein SAMN04487941_4163 [Pontibacter akesuensis]